MLLQSGLSQDVEVSGNEVVDAINQRLSSDWIWANAAIYFLQAVRLFEGPERVGWYTRRLAVEKVGRSPWGPSHSFVTRVCRACMRTNRLIARVIICEPLSC